MSAPTGKSGVVLSDVRVGDSLPELSIPLTASLIVAGALASRDFTPVHHDRSAAQATGLRDVFMNILTTNGLVGRYITDWTGPDAVIRNVAIKLGAPNLPGDTLTFSGTVASREGDELRIEIKGKNSWGDHVTGTVRVVISS
ncbi:MAG: MaoC family dehydratase [Myxococcales bacterium]|nr:MaoC family dehydratase [Myxococcales bacterium]